MLTVSMDDRFVRKSMKPKAKLMSLKGLGSGGPSMRKFMGLSLHNQSSVDSKYFDSEVPMQ